MKPLQVDAQPRGLVRLRNVAASRVHAASFVCVLELVLRHPRPMRRRRGQNGQVLVENLGAELPARRQFLQLAAQVSFIKTSYTRNINDLRAAEAATSDKILAMIVWLRHFLGWLRGVFSSPRGSHPRKPCSASAVARSSRPTASPTTHYVAQAVLGRAAKAMGSMERTSHPGDTQNRCRLASCWLSAVLEMAFKSQVEGRSKAGEQRNSSLDLSNGC